MNKATNTIKALTETLNNRAYTETEKRVVVTVAYRALCDIYGRATADAVLWAVCETCHHAGEPVPASVVETVKELTT